MNDSLWAINPYYPNLWPGWFFSFLTSLWPMQLPITSTRLTEVHIWS